MGSSYGYAGTPYRTSGMPSTRPNFRPMSYGFNPYTPPTANPGANPAQPATGVPPTAPAGMQSPLGLPSQAAPQPEAPKPDPLQAFRGLTDAQRFQVLTALPMGDMSQYGMGMTGSGIAGSIQNQLWGEQYKKITGQNWSPETVYYERPGWNQWNNWINEMDYSQGGGAQYDPLTGKVGSDGYFDPASMGYTPAWQSAARKSWFGS